MRSLSVKAGLSASLAVALFLTSTQAVAYAAASVPPLTGEVLAGLQGIQDPTPFPPQGGCDASGFTYSYSTSGPAGGDPDVANAVGPYPGTFTESGTVTVGPNQITNPVSNGIAVQGVVLDFDAQFTIYSGEAVIRGTKRLLGQSPAQVMTCANFSEPNPDVGGTHQAYVRSFRLTDVVYEVTITRPAGTFQDTGQTVVELDNSQVYSPLPGVFRTFAERFREYFVSSEGIVPIASRPGKGCGDKNHIHERMENCRN